MEAQLTKPISNEISSDDKNSLSSKEITKIKEPISKKL